MSEIRIPQNNYFNNDFKICIKNFYHRNIYKNQFKEINFNYLFNLPMILERNGNIKIKINEDIANYYWDRNFINQIKNRMDEILLKFDGYDKVEISLNCPWRLVIGLGASHPQETSMTLHHIYGIPYIPSSAIKGVTRHWVVLKFADENRDFIIKEIKEKENNNNPDFNDVLKKVSNALEKGDDLNISISINNNNITFKELIDIFGTQNQKGKVIFFDAYPMENINLKIDIMNPHYPDYYGGKEPPTDWQNPLPIKFLTVENTKFQFYLASKESTLLAKAKELLLDALKNYGIGAKTSLGYGIFN